MRVSPEQLSTALFVVDALRVVHDVVVDEREFYLEGMLSELAARGKPSKTFQNVLKRVVGPMRFQVASDNLREIWGMARAQSAPSADKAFTDGSDLLGG